MKGKSETGGSQVRSKGLIANDGAIRNCLGGNDGRFETSESVIEPGRPIHAIEF
jgi:hypothetical protein